MVEMFLTGESKNNIGTYIIINTCRMLICDEYGRTFYVHDIMINDLVNTLIEENYKRNPHPEKYVKTRQKIK